MMTNSAVKKRTLVMLTQLTWLRKI